MTTRSSIALFSTLLLASATAQPTLNLANNGPVPVITPYDVSTYGAATETYGPGEPGASSIYSFWMVPQTGNNAQYFVAPTVTPTSNSIPGTTVISTDGGSDSTFYRVDATGIEQLGVRSALEGVLAYTDGIVELVYPCALGTTWNDIFAANYTISSIPVTRAGTINGLADGYGSLALPAVEVDEVLRVKVRKVANDISAIATIRRTFDTYYYYQEGVNFPLMMTSLDSVTISGGSPTIVFTMEWLYGEGNIGMQDLRADQVVFTPYPNPTNGRIDLQLGAEVANMRSVELFDASGRSVMQVSKPLAGNINGVLDVSALPAGVYQVRLTQADGKLGTRSIVVQ
ncbi:MAG: T9SS type A sorting domain-containing protein [Flavobacteriales bacterium]|nr:T9SS type A sorting domain-containing protein [Flavobacteriales bacterium]